MDVYVNDNSKKIVKSLFGCQECKRRKIKCSNNANGTQQGFLKSLPACVKCIKANKENDCVYLTLEEQRQLRKIRKLLRKFAKDEDIDNRDIIKDYIRGNLSIDLLQSQTQSSVPKPKKQKTEKSQELDPVGFTYTPEILNDNFDWNYGLDDLMKSIINIGVPESLPIQDIEFDYNSQYNSFATNSNTTLHSGENDEPHEALEVDFVTDGIDSGKVHKHVRKRIEWKHIEQILSINQFNLKIKSIDIKNFYNFYHNVSYWIFPFDKISKGNGTINYIVFDYILDKISGKYHSYELLKDPLVLIILALSAEYRIVIENGTNGEKDEIIPSEKYASAALQILNLKISSMASDERLLKANIGSLTVTILLIVIYTSSENGGGWKEHHLAAKVIYQKYLLALAKEDNNNNEHTSSLSKFNSNQTKKKMNVQEENLFKLFKQWFPTFDLLASAITAEKGVLKTAEYNHLFRENFSFLSDGAFGIDTKDCKGCRNYDVTSDFYCINDKNEVYNIFQGCGNVLTNLLVKLLDYTDVKETLDNPDISTFYEMMKDLTKCRDFYVRKTKDGLLVDQQLGKQLFDEGGNGILEINSKFYSIFDMSHLMHTALVNIIIFQKFNIGDVNLNGFIKQNLQKLKEIFGQLFLEKTPNTLKHYEDANNFYRNVIKTSDNNIKTLSVLFFQSPSARKLIELQGSLSYNLLMVFSSVQMYALSLTPEVDDYIDERIKVIGYCQVLHTQLGSAGGLTSCFNFIKIWKMFDEDPTSYKNMINLKSLSDKSVPFI